MWMAGHRRAEATPSGLSLHRINYVPETEGAIAQAAAILFAWESSILIFATGIAGLNK